MLSTAPPSRPAPGFTLLELITVVTVLAVVCALAAPVLHDVVPRWRADMVRMRMVTAFNLARNTAITRASPMVVCPSADGRTCGGDWSRGWLIHQDRGLDALPGPDDILHFQSGARAGAVRAEASVGRTRLRYQRDGRSSGSTLTVTLCAGDALHSQVIVNNVGRTRAQRVREAQPCPH